MANAILNVGSTGGQVNISTAAAPATPAAGVVTLYAGTDKALHALNSDGLDITIAAAGAGSPITEEQTNSLISTGVGATGTSNTSVAIGYNSSVQCNDGNIAIGSGAVSNSQTGGLPARATTVIGSYACAVGPGNIALGQNSLACGSDSALAIGNYAKACCDYGIAIGPVVGSSAIKGIAIGYGICNCANSSIALGNGDGTTTTAVGAACSIAIGNTPKIFPGATGTIVLGNSSVGGTGACNSVVIGNSARTTGACSVVIGQAACATSSNQIIIGNCATSAAASGCGNIVIGVGACGRGTDGIYPERASITIGTNADANQSSVAIGQNAKASGGTSLAIGEACASGTNTISLGRVSCASANLAHAIGYAAFASGTCSYSFGFSSCATASNAIAIGSESISSHCFAVALGSCISTERANTTHVNSLIAYGQAASKTNAVGSTGGTVTINWDNSNIQTLTLDSDITTLTKSNPIDGAVYTLFLTQGGTGGKTVSWGSDVEWPGGTPPTLSTAAGAVDAVSLVYIAGVTGYYGNANLNFS